METLHQVQTLHDLRSFVHRTLCERENILADQFGLAESRLLRNGRICGWQFTVHGPRSLRLHAIWDADLNVVYFYGTRGERFQKVGLRQRLAVS